MPKILGQTISKPEERGPNEDAIRIDSALMGVSDGAGGYGIFAEKWAAHLVKNLPKNPITSYKEFCKWCEAVWEPFYNRTEQEVIQLDAFVVNKFYNEGSCATLAAGWLKAKKIVWFTFGDSVIQGFNPKNSQSFCTVPDVGSFAENPLLINWKEAPREKGFQCGKLFLHEFPIVCFSSDALACYLRLCWLWLNTPNSDELQRLKSTGSRINNQLTSIIKYYPAKSDFFESILIPLISSLESDKSFSDHLMKLFLAGVLAKDDWSLVCIQNTAY